MTDLRAQVFEVIVLHALAGAPWQELFASMMQFNSISHDEVEAEVQRRGGSPSAIKSASAPDSRAQILDATVRQAMAGAPWQEVTSELMRDHSITPAEVDAELQKRFGIDDKFLREVVLHIAVQRAIADPSWRKELTLVLERLGIVEEEVEAGVRLKRYEMTEDVQTQIPRTDKTRRWLIDCGFEDSKASYLDVSAIESLGGSLCCVNHFSEAELVLQYAMALIPTLGNNPASRTLTSMAAHSLSILYEKTKRYAEAERYWEVWVGNEKPRELALLAKANLCLKQSKFDQAETLYRQAIASLEQLENSDTKSGFAKSDKAKSMRMRAQREMLLGLGQVYIATNDLNKAETVLTDANVISKRFGQSSQFEVWKHLSQIHLIRGDVPQAKELLNDCINFLEKSPTRNTTRWLDLMAELKARYARCIELDRLDQEQHH